jgi:hypothetical protein
MNAFVFSVPLASDLTLLVCIAPCDRRCWVTSKGVSKPRSIKWPEKTRGDYAFQKTVCYMTLFKLFLITFHSQFVMCDRYVAWFLFRPASCVFPDVMFGITAVVWASILEMFVSILLRFISALFVRDRGNVTRCAVPPQPD